MRARKVSAAISPQKNSLAPLDLREVFSLCVSEQRAEAEQKGVSFVFDFDDSPVLLPIREQDAERMIGNLLSNAAQYAPVGDTVFVTLTQKRRRVTFSVTNSGQIAPEQVPYLWEVFFRADEVRTDRDNTSGFGLPICNRILQLHRLRPLFRQGNGSVTFGFSGKSR